MTSIRAAQEGDVDTLVAIGEEMLAGSSFAPLHYSPLRVAAFVRRCIAEGFAAVSLQGDEITGVVLGDIVQPWYSEDRMGVEHVLYVRPQHQGSRAALMLVRAWMVWCFECGAKQLRPGTSAGSAAADRLYAAMGFERTGALYVMNRKDSDVRQQR